MNNSEGRYLNFEDKKNTSQVFEDGQRSIDFVLAFDGENKDVEKTEKRAHFLRNLIAEGLELELDETHSIHFVKLHVPIAVMCRYADILKIKMKSKINLKKSEDEKSVCSSDSKNPEEEENKYSMTKFLRFICKCYRQSSKKEPLLYCEFSIKYIDLFDWKETNFFDSCVRNLIVNFILERQRFVDGEETSDNFGVEKLIEDGVLESAYPLHNSSHDERSLNSNKTNREFLLNEWANMRKWNRFQPLDKVQEYFGSKVTIYFAWLGFYTDMLIPLSVFGILCFIYGLITWTTDPISKHICNNKNITIMCPQCDRNCDFWQLHDICKSSKMNYLIDNRTTVVFAFVLSIWAVMYLELWKRYSAGLVYRWGLTGFSQHVEHPRPQYLAKLRNTKKFPPKEIPSQVLEPDVPYWTTKFLPSFTSYSIMVLFICISVIAIFSVIIYRMAQRASHSILGNEDSTTYKILVLPMTAGIIDLIVISLLDYAYSNLAVYLTNMEYCRTQTEHDESLTIKKFAFQFVNYYSSLFYIAFLKGKFVGYPAKYNHVLGFRQEECNPGGCLMELCMQLVIIMVGKQVLNAVVEMLIPYMTNMYRKYLTKDKHKCNNQEKVDSQLMEDFNLEPWDNGSLFDEYLEMVVQFGFIILFGLAFPLAPFLALINNVIEVRLDAIKMLRFFRRPVAQRANNIGVWYTIMTIITKISVASTAMIIAFSTNLVPKIIYRAATHDKELTGYLNFTLAYFNTKDFQVKPILPHSPYENVTSCRYSEFRNPPWDDHPYKRPMIYWKILTARLAFIVIYQNIISMIQAAISWAIPDVPEKLRKRIKREDLLMRERIIKVMSK